MSGFTRHRQEEPFREKRNGGELEYGQVEKI
jgi:hypothetical protein